MITEKVIESPEAEPVPVLKEDSEKDEVKAEESDKIERFNCFLIDSHANKSLTYFFCADLPMLCKRKKKKL
jgi:hypothetical protein